MHRDRVRIESNAHACRVRLYDITLVPCRAHCVFGTRAGETKTENADNSEQHPCRHERSRSYVFLSASSVVLAGLSLGRLIYVHSSKFCDV